MARRRRKSGQPVSLFPFLSILACVIGVLTLLIAGLSLGAMAQDTSGPEYVLVTREAVAMEEERTRLEQLVVQALAAAEQLALARKALRRLEQDKDACEPLRGEHVELLAQVERQRKALAKLNEDIRDLEESVEEHRKRLTKLVKEISNPSGPIVLQGPRANGDAAELTPRFVECREKQVVIDVDLPVSQRTTHYVWGLKTNVEYLSFLREVRRQEGGKGIVVFLIRPRGVETFDLAYRVAKEREKVACGFLPVPGNRRLDFSLLSKAKKR